MTVIYPESPKRRDPSIPPADIDTARKCLTELIAEGRSLGIPQSYIRTLNDTTAVVDFIEKARTP